MDVLLELDTSGSRLVHGAEVRTLKGNEHGSEEEEKAREESPDDVNDADDGKGSERRGKHSKKPDRRNKFDTGVSWIKISFPSAKDPSWNDRYPGKSTCVITIEADNDFVSLASL